MVAEEAAGGASLLGEVVLRLGEVEQVQAEIAVVVAAVAPVHVEKSVCVEAVHHKGVALDQHGVGCVEDGAAGRQFAAEHRRPVLGGIAVAVGVVHEAVAKGPLQGGDETAYVCAALAQPPVHPCRHTAVVRQTRHGVGRLGRVLPGFIARQNQTCVDRRARQDVGDGVVVRRPAMQGVLQGNRAAVVGEDFLECRSYAAHYAPLLRRPALDVGIVGAVAVEGGFLVTHHVAQKRHHGREVALGEEGRLLYLLHRGAKGADRWRHLLPRGAEAVGNDGGQAAVGGCQDERAAGRGKQVGRGRGAAQ